MSTLFASVFESETAAVAIRTALLKMPHDDATDLEDSVVVVRKPGGIIEISEALDLAPSGRVRTGFWQLLIALIFLNPQLGASAYARTGPLSARFTYLGMNDEVMRELARSMKPGTSALFVLVHRTSADGILERLVKLVADARIFQSSLRPDHEAALREALERAA